MTFTACACAEIQCPKLTIDAIHRSQIFPQVLCILHTTSKLTQGLLCIVIAARKTARKIIVFGKPRPQVREGETVFGVERPVAVGWRLGGLCGPGASY